MNVDVLFTSTHSGTLYAGIERGKMFTGKPVRDGVMYGPMKSNMAGTLVARFVTRIELPDHDKALPLHADVMVEGAVSPVGLGQFLTSHTEQRGRRAASKDADGSDKADDADDAKDAAE